MPLFIQSEFTFTTLHFVSWRIFASGDNFFANSGNITFLGNRAEEEPWCSLGDEFFSTFRSFFLFKCLASSSIFYFDMYITLEKTLLKFGS